MERRAVIRSRIESAWTPDSNYFVSILLLRLLLLFGALSFHLLSVTMLAVTARAHWQHFRRCFSHSNSALGDAWRGMEMRGETWRCVEMRGWCDGGRLRSHSRREARHTRREDKCSYDTLQFAPVSFSFRNTTCYLFV